MSVLDNIKEEIKIQKRISAVVINKSNSNFIIMANTFFSLAKQTFCKHNFAGLECLKCGKRRGIDKIYEKK